MIRSIILLSLSVIAVTGTAHATELDFARDVQPILAEHCFVCHGADAAESSLRLDVRGDALKAADSGKRAIVPGDTVASELLVRVTSRDPDTRMPPEKEPLGEKEIAILTKWISGGANWTRHWAYRPLQSHVVPSVKGEDWIQNSIDRFVLAKLEEVSLEPSGAAPRDKLIRRLSYDLLGLPASTDAIERYVTDVRPGAYERIVDEFLSSPHFGERWGRHWLDKARYADSDGYEKDNNRPNAWRYRDWVINAVNQDLPFDQFTIQQLAGDLLDAPTDEQILATAFHRQTLTNTEGGTDQEQWRVAAVMDRTETVGTVWLGLTIGCARCHNHKYDQITQAEYYQLYAFFNNADEASHQLPPTNEQLQRFQTELLKHEAEIDAKRAELMTLSEPCGDESRDVEVESLKARVKQLEDAISKLAKAKPRRPTFKVRVVADRQNERRQTHILRRGEFKQPLDPVEPETLAVLPVASTEQETAERLQLARWLVSGDNPLVARVVVNHVWMRLFGQGLVATPNDFGVRGEAPSHPELLDHLATEYIRLGWSRKALIRKIVLSATYRQSSKHRPDLVDIDPANRLLYRQNRFRLEAEAIRDVTLSVAGLLSDRVGGPSVFPPMPPEAAAVSYANNFKWSTSSGGDRFRRGMYTYFKRTAPHPTLTTFDCPDSNVTNVERNRSNTPIGALVLLNNEVYAEAAVSFAKSVLRRQESDSNRLAWAMRACVARPPTNEELAKLTRLLHESRSFFHKESDQANRLVKNHIGEGDDAAEVASWSATLRVLLNLDEFITRD